MQSSFDICRSNQLSCSMEKGILKNLRKFAGKQLWQSFFFNKVEGLRPAALLKKRLWHKCFPLNFVKLLRTPFLQNTSGRLLLCFWFLSFHQNLKVCALKIRTIKYFQEKLHHGYFTGFLIAIRPNAGYWGELERQGVQKLLPGNDWSMKRFKIYRLGYKISFKKTVSVFFPRSVIFLYINIQFPHGQHDSSTNLTYPRYPSLLPYINLNTSTLQIPQVFITPSFPLSFRQVSDLLIGRWNHHISNNNSPYPSLTNVSRNSPLPNISGVKKPHLPNTENKLEQ